MVMMAQANGALESRGKEDEKMDPQLRGCQDFLLG